MNNDLKPINTIPNFKRFCMTIGELPTSYLETMTYYEMLVWFTEYMKNTIIPTINNNGLAVQELQDKYIELKSYVDDYFTNLDVQQEINNKLDQMVQDGTLQEIIASYLNSKALFGFDNVQAMKNATNLIDGSYAKTLGYYTKNDGGSALYKIRQITNSDVVDNMFIISLNNENLIGELITLNQVNILQIGAKADNVTDNTSILQNGANYCKNNNLKYYIPEGSYKTGSITIDEVKFIRIDGDINLINSTDDLNIYENVNGETPNIYINKVTNGNIIMKGLNSANVTIQNANKLILLADNTPNHNFIGYTTFNLGFIRHLEIKDDGSGTKWINENLFIGGRFLSITIGGDNSTYGHQNNLFFKPLCEHTKINIILGYCNHIIDARLEGDVEISFGENTIGNVITSNFGETLQGMLFPKYYDVLSTKYTDLSNGKNKVINNSEINEINVISLNKFNNPKNIAIEGDYLKPTTNQTMYETDYIEIPKTIFMLFLKIDNPRLNWRIKCYDENKEIVSQPDLTINSPTLGLVSSGVYGNSAYNRDNYWAIFNPENTSVKYIKMLINSTPSYSDELFKNINLIFTSYNNYTDYQYFIDGLKKCI